VAEKCYGTTDCPNLVSQLAITIGNATTYEANETATAAAISSSLSTALNVPSEDVTVLQIRGWPINLQKISSLLSRRMQAPPEGSLDSFWMNTEPIVDSNGVAMVKFLVERLPVTLPPRSIPGRAAQLAALIDTALGKGSVTSVQFTPWPPWFPTKSELQSQLWNLIGHGSGTPSQVCAAVASETKQDRGA